MKFSRGLAALIFVVFSHTTLFANYLYKDDVVNNPKFTNEIEALGKELFDKTGISLRLVMLRDIPNGLHIEEYQEELIKDFTSPTVLLSFAELDGKVDILANDSSLYNYFDKKQILSPVASTAQAIAMGLFFADDVEDFSSLIQNSGGTIIPLLANKSKAGEHIGKYSAAMYNGYLDLGEQISRANNVELSMATGNGSKIVMIVVKFVFYSIVLFGIIFYIRKKILLRRKINDV